MGRPMGSKNKTDRPKRLTFKERNTLTMDNQDKNYHYRVVNDKDGRPEKLESYGYEYVHGDEQLGDPTVDGASPLGSVVTKPVGGGMNGVLMRIKREDFEQDQADKQREIDENEQSLHKKSEEDGHYGKLKINRSKSA